ncbi:hypothetical protein V1477_015499 [Vespula maculifrons]|uniref:Uncharacterized protein n=1 Tax=Vespula maculifrons TaxID=7453 RepID=A0ABD2BFZ6_VESMC
MIILIIIIVVVVVVIVASFRNFSTSSNLSTQATPLLDTCYTLYVRYARGGSNNPDTTQHNTAQHSNSNSNSTAQQQSIQVPRAKHRLISFLPYVQCDSKRLGDDRSYLTVTIGTKRDLDLCGRVSLMGAKVYGQVEDTIP